MGEIVNLRRARKARNRAVAASKAATNRALYGRTTAQRNADRLTQQRLDTTLDGAKLNED